METNSLNKFLVCHKTHWNQIDWTQGFVSLCEQTFKDMNRITNSQVIDAHKFMQMLDHIVKP